MGHRCIYALRQGGVVTTYYAHWGALRILWDFYWGRDAALAFLARQDPTKHATWLDEIWGEGAAAIDLDARTVTIFDDELEPPTRALAIDVAREIWARDGFTFHAVDWYGAVPLAVGVDPETVETAHAAAVFDAGNDDMTGRGDGYFRVAISLDGELRFAGYDGGVLEVGEARLHELSRLPDLAEATARWQHSATMDWERDKESLADRVTDVIVIDRAAKQIHSLAITSTACRHYRSIWPGWEIIRYGRFDRHEIRARAGLPALPPEYDELTLDEQVARLEARVAREATDMGEWFRTTTADLAIDAEWINPHAGKPTFDGRPRDAGDADARFRRALEAVLARRRAM